MKKKLLLTTLTCAFVFNSFAQGEVENKLANIDWEEDSTDVTTVNDIVKIQQSIALNNSTGSHLRDVWGRRVYFDLCYNNGKLKSREAITTGPNATTDIKDKDYKSDWGVSIKWGQNFRLHKKPIANIIGINLDYTWVDLNVNHYKYKEGYKFDGTATFTDEKGNLDCYYTPWDFEKYEVSYGMALGPSITFTPFAFVKSKGLHFFKINVYYHFGYNVALTLIPKDDNKEHYTSSSIPSDAKTIRLNLANDFYSAVGFNISWKTIGIGFETRSANYDYKPIDVKFGENKYKFKSTTSRVYLQFRL